jgi:glutathione synthase
MKLCYSIEEVIDFAALFPIVLKPLKAYGGQGILKIDGDKLDNGENIFNTTEYLLRIQEPLESEGYLAMKFLKNVHLGDKRILVVGGEIMASSLRLPPENAWLCNVAQGGQAELTTADEDEKAIIKSISPILEENGILIFGVDTLVDDDGKRILSEVNTLSIGGFMQAEEQSGLPIIKKTIDKIFNYADAQFQQCSTN